MFRPIFENSRKLEWDTLVEHVRRAGFNLGLKNGIPQLLCLDRLACLALLFILFKQGLVDGGIV